MPVHSQHGAEGLEPERIAEAREKRGGSVIVNDGLGDRGTEPRHALGEPWRHTPTVQRQIRDARPFHVNYLATDYADLAIAFTYPSNVETGSENHREQEEDRDQHDETIPELLQHSQNLRCQTEVR